MRFLAAHRPAFRYATAQDSSLDQPNSLFLLALTEVFPTQIMLSRLHIGANEQQIVLAGTGGIRYDLYECEITRDDTMTISPFRDRFYAFRGLTNTEASAVLEQMQAFLPDDPRPLPFGSMVATSAPNLSRL